MARRKSSITWYSFTTSAIIVFVALLGIFFFTYVPVNRENITDRNLRILSVMGNQIKVKVENFGTVLKNIGENSREEVNLESTKLEIIKNKIKLVPNLDLAQAPNYSKKPGLEEDTASTEHLNVYEILENNDYTLHFQYMIRDTSKKERQWLKLHTKTNLSNLISPIISRKEFDNVLLVKINGHEGEAESNFHDKTGAVIFQKNRAGATIKRLDSVKNKKNETISVNMLANNSSVSEISITGSDYTVFGHPVIISFYHDNLGLESNSETWLLCGLMKTSDYNAQSRKISNTYIIIFMFLAIAALLSIPIIKVQFMGPQDTLERFDVIFLALSLLVLSSLITNIFLDFYTIYSHKRVFDTQLKDFATQIKTNFRNEIEDGMVQLNELNEAYGEPGMDSIETNVLNKDNLSINYPYFEMAYWIDGQGQQKGKWSVKSAATPLINVSNRPYFSKLINNQGFYLKTGGKGINYMLQPINSWTTGRNETILTIPFHSSTRDTIHNQNLQSIRVSAIAMHMLSLYNPVIPPGYGFAIINEEGGVLYHHDSKRNLQENFFEECDNSRPLHSVVFGRESKFLSLKYAGSDHHIYVTPLDSPPWTLIVFRDKDLFNSINAEMLAIAVAVFIVYMLFLIVVLILTKIIMGKRFDLKLSLIWPDITKLTIYRELSWIYLFIGAILYGGFMIFSFPPKIILILSFGSGAFAILFFYFTQKRKKPFWRSTYSSRKSLAWNYVFMWLMLFLMVSVLPTIGFFKFAYQTESELFVKYGHIKMAGDLKDRANRLNAAYKNVKGEPAKSGLNIKLAFKDTSDIYKSFYFNTKINISEQTNIDQMSKPHRLENMLLHNMFYNNLNIPVMEMRGLISDYAGDKSWHWKHLNGNLMYEKNRFDKDESLIIESRLPTIEKFNRSKSEEQPLYLLFTLFIPLIFWGLFAMLRLIAKTVFLFDFPVTEENQKILEEEWQFHNLLLLHPANDKMPDFIDPQKAHIIDLHTEEYWNPEKIYPLLPENKIILIDHFEFSMTKPEYNRKLLSMLEELVLSHEKNVIILSTVDPEHLNRNIQANAEETMKRYNRNSILDHFRHVIILDRGNTAEFKEKMQSYNEKIQTLKDKERRKHLLFLSKKLTLECAATTHLQRIAVELINSRFKSHETLESNEAQVIEEVRKYARSHYQSIWRTCSISEKLTLIDLAKDGFINNQDHKTIGNLLGCGLIRRKPHFQLMNESFRKFVLSEYQPEMVSQDKSSWGKLKIPFIAVILAVVLFLFYTQPDLFKSTIAIVSAITAGIPALIRLLGSTKLGKSDSKSS